MLAFWVKFCCRPSTGCIGTDKSEVARASIYPIVFLMDLSLRHQPNDASYGCSVVGTSGAGTGAASLTSPTLRLHSYNALSSWAFSMRRLWKRLGAMLTAHSGSTLRVLCTRDVFRHWAMIRLFLNDSLWVSIKWKEQFMTYRVVQWTTGNVGEQTALAILASPDLELIGCYAWSETKRDKDINY